MKVFKSLLAGLAVLSMASAVQGETSEQASLEQIKEQISAALNEGKPGVILESIEATPLPGIYKANLANGPHVYATEDGGHFIAGDLFRVTPGRIVNMTDEARNTDRAKAMASVDEKNLITFSPEGEVKQRIYVFTDVDCGYCQVMHSKVEEYNAMGLEISYLAYPRAGVNSASYNKTVSAWCADDPHDAITQLKLRRPIPEKTCAESPVADQFNLGRQIGLTGTPALVLESGELIAGYLEPARLKQALGL